MFGLGKTQSIKLERDLYDRVKKIADVAGYATVEEFVAHVMQADHLGTRVLIGKMTAHGVKHVRSEFLVRVTLCEDRRADRVGGEAAVGVLLNNEDDFRVHGGSSYVAGSASGNVKTTRADETESRSCS